MENQLFERKHQSWTSLVRDTRALQHSTKLFQHLSWSFHTNFVLKTHFFWNCHFKRRGVTSAFAWRSTRRPRVHAAAPPQRGRAKCEKVLKRTIYFDRDGIRTRDLCVFVEFLPTRLSSLFFLIFKQQKCRDLLTIEVPTAVTICFL